MICKWCEKKEATHIQRELCGGCYSKFHESGELDELFPKNRANLTKKKVTPEMMEAYTRLINDSSLTLDMVGKEFGYTRERARQVFEIIFGYKYTVIKKKREAERKERIRLLVLQKRNPRYKVANS